ncbi:hypothetical protein ACHAWF_013797 [Thalassiosira exigua]
MEELSAAKARLKTSLDEVQRLYDSFVAQESSLKNRLNHLNLKKDLTNVNLDVTDDDIVEVNAGGKIIAARRATLTQVKGTFLDALFSGRWDKKLQRDQNGRIFLDINPYGFRAIVDYLSELIISSEEDSPTGNMSIFSCTSSNCLVFNIFNDCLIAILSKMMNILPYSTDGWMKMVWVESWGYYTALRRMNFHSKCDGRGSTLTIIETTDGCILGGYSTTPWASSGGFRPSNNAFLFVLSYGGGSSPCKMKLKNPEDSNAVYFHESAYGIAFGQKGDLTVRGSDVAFNAGHSYESEHARSLGKRSFTIKEIETFQVVYKSDATMTKISSATKDDPSSIHLKELNESVQHSLLKAEVEVCQLEERLKAEQHFIDAFASGDTKDVVTLNVSGSIMTTKRSTLQTIEDSVLAQQFNAAKWTQQGRNAQMVDKWKPEDVSAWARNIDNVSDDVAEIFIKNNIAGNELLALKKDGLLTLGITRTGTVCLLLEEIKKLERSNKGAAAFIEHSPYCFGKILDYLRLKRLHTEGFTEEPVLPQVCESQKSRFDKVVAYYFPGDISKPVLGG